MLLGLRVVIMTSRKRAEEEVGLSTDSVHPLQEVCRPREPWSDNDREAAVDPEPSAVLRAPQKNKGGQL